MSRENLRYCSCGALLASQVPGRLCPSCMAAGLFGMEVDEMGAASGGGPSRLGDYELGDELGRGGMGVVYRARSVGLNRSAAVKLILAGPLASPLERQRFLAEAEAAAALDHPGLVSIYEAGEEDGQAWFAMQLIEGESLAARLRRDRAAFAPREAAALVLRVARAVQHAHERGFLHRDLKPGNIILDAAGTPHVTDFGLARRIDSEAHLTLTGGAVGTPSYMAPEQTDTRRPPTTAVDVYSLGAILYELLRGQPPFLADSLPELFMAIREQEPPSLLGGQPAVDRDLDVICRKCLEKDPVNRYRTAQLLAEDLQHWLDGEPISARAVSRTERLGRWCRRKPALATLATACVFLLAGGAGGILWQWRQAVDQARRADAHALRESEARADAEALTRQARLSLYAADMNLCQAALRANNLGRARRLLDAHRPSPGSEDLRGWEWRYLWAQCRSGALCRLTPTPTSVTGVVCSPDSLLAVSNDATGRIDYHDVAARRISSTNRTEHDSGPLIPHPDGKSFLAPVRSHFCELWNFARTTPRPFALVSGLAAAAFSPDGSLLAVQGFNGEVRIFTVRDSVVVADILLPRITTGHGGAVAFIPGQPLRLAVGTEESIKIYRCGDWSLEREWLAHPRNVLSALVASPDGRRLASGAGFSDPVIRIWDPSTGGNVAELNAHTSWISTVMFSRDGFQLFGASADQTISVWRTDDWTTAGILRGHTDEIWSLNPAGDGLISGAKNGEVLVWSGGSAPRAAGRYQFNDRTRMVLEAGDGDLIEVRSDVMVRRTPGSWQRGVELPLPGEPLHASPAGLIVFRAGNGRTGVLDAMPQPPVLLGDLDMPEIEHFCADPRRRWIAFSHAGGSVTLFDVASRKGRQVAGAGTVLALGSDERRGHLVVRTPEHVVRCDPATGRWQDPDCPVSAEGVVACDPQFHWMAQMADRRVTLSRLSPWERLAALDQESNVPSLAFAANGRWLAVANEAAWARLWPLPETGPLPEPLILRGHLNAIFSLTFTPDSGRIVTLCKDAEAAKFWEAETGMELLTLAGNETFLYLSRFTSDGETLLAGRDHHAWQAWHAPSLETIAAAEAGQHW